MMRKLALICVVSCGLMMLLFGAVVSAQENDVTADEVNAIAKKLYCPVCENIPLDTCGTAACEDWRYEIRLQLEDGKSEQQIVDDFVTRFGDRVVGTPQDPTLRALSLVTPWVVIFLAGVGVIFALIRLRTRQVEKPKIFDTTGDTPTDDYEALLKQDLSG